jgi:hypothetical protein
MTEEIRGPSGPGTVVLELGADVGALVLHTPAELDGREIEISRGVHDLGRRAEPGRPGRDHRRPGHQLELAGLNPSRGWPDPPWLLLGRPGRAFCARHGRRGSCPGGAGDTTLRSAKI